MALTREFLEQRGLESDVITAIMKEHGKTVNPLNEQVSELTTSKEQLTSQLNERDNQLKELKENGDDSLKEKIAELEKVNQDKDKQLEQTRKAHKVELLAKEIGANDTEWAKDKLEKLEFKDGELVGHEEYVNKLKENHPTLFAQQKVIKPWSQGGVSTVQHGEMTKEDILKIKDKKERESAIASNLHLFK